MRTFQLSGFYSEAKGLSLAYDFYGLMKACTGCTSSTETAGFPRSAAIPFDRLGILVLWVSCKVL